MALSGWDPNKKIKIAPGAGLLTEPLTDVSLPLHLRAVIPGVTPTSVSENFDGADDSPPNPVLWDPQVCSGGSIATTGGQLLVDIPVTAADLTSRVVFLPEISGDFVVEVDYEILFYDPPSSSYSYPLFLEVFEGANSFGIGCNGSGFSYVTSGNKDWATSSVPFPMAGKLKLAKSGAAMRAWYWDGAGWTWLGNSEGFLSVGSYTSPSIRLRSTGDFNGGSIVAINSFTLTADGIAVASGSGLSGFDAAPVFTELAGAYRKIAVEIGETGQQLPVGLVPADWDQAGSSATIYPEFSVLAAADEFYLYYDAGQADNPLVAELGSTPAAPGQDPALAAWNLAAADDLFDLAVVAIPGAMLRAMVDQPYDLTAYLVRMLIDQLYPLAEPRRTQLEQLYSLRLQAMLDQYYGNLPVRRAQLVQLWGAAQALRARLEQQYGDSAKYRAALEQLYTFNAGLRTLCDQPWSVASQPLRVVFDELYAELDRDLLRAALEELYVLAAGEAVVQVIDISITVDGQQITSYHNINDEQDESLYYLTGELQLTDQAEFAFCRRLASRVVITVDGASSHYLVEEPRTARTESGTGYVVPLVSETILLGHAESELAVAAEKNWTGMRKALVQELAAPFAVDWRLPNTFLPANILYTNGRSRIELIRELVRSLGGIVQTSPAGELVCRPEYPQPVNSWNEAAPDVELTDQDDFFQITGQPSSRPGYDRFFLTNDQVSGDDLRLEVEELSSREQQLQITPVPFSEQVVLHHSGGEWVQVVADGVVETAVAEQVEFVEGAGRTSRPVHGDVAVDWRQNDLGAVVASEDGGLTVDVAGNSLAWVEYRTRAVQFRVISDRVENVQVYPEVVA